MKIDLRAQKINANDDHIQVAHWHVGEGEFVHKGQELADVSTSKVAMTLTCEHEGFLHQIKREGQRVKIGDVFASIFTEASEIPAADEDDLSKTKVVANARHVYDFTRFSDAALSLIQEHNLDQGLFKNMGLVSAAVVNLKIQELAAQKSPLLPPVSTSPFRTQGTFGPKEIEIQQLTLGQSGLINSHLTVQFHAQSVLEKLASLGRDQMSLLPIVLHEFSRLVKSRPLFTAFYRDNKIHFYDEVTVGLALDTGRGLKVAGIPRAAELSPSQWKEKITDLAMKDLRGQLSNEDLRPSSVTVTDLSSLDILHFQPLINGAQSCILGIGGDRSLPDYPMTLTMNFDHRVLTGREVGEFLQELKTAVLSYRNL